MSGCVDCSGNLGLPVAVVLFPGIGSILGALQIWYLVEIVSIGFFYAILTFLVLRFIVVFPN